VSLADLARDMIALTGKGSINLMPFPLERQMIDIGNAYSSCQKIERALGWRPDMPLEEGLALTIEFYERNRRHYWEPEANTFPRFNAAKQRG
jgi:UDP-glucose 4-epimerase